MNPYREIRLEIASKAQRGLIENLFTYYVYDMSEYMAWDPDDTGRYSFNSTMLDVYWQPGDHTPYLVFVDGNIAGFALVRRYPNAPHLWDMGQFFVLRKYKGQGIGKRALELVVKAHPGRWQIRVLKENVGAQRFWQSAIRALVNEDYQQSLALDVDLEMMFLHFACQEQHSEKTKQCS